MWTAVKVPDSKSFELLKVSCCCGCCRCTRRVLLTTLIIVGPSENWATVRLYRMTWALLSGGTLSADITQLLTGTIGDLIGVFRSCFLYSFYYCYFRACYQLQLPASDCLSCWCAMQITNQFSLKDDKGWNFHPTCGQRRTAETPKRLSSS